jgi:hypothetical protein
MARDEEIYVYAVAEGGAPARLRVLGQSLRALRAADVSLIVERAGGDHEISEEALRRQHALVEALAGRLDPILPVRFGTSGLEGDLLRRAVASSAALRAALDHVRGMAQMTVRIHLPESSIELPSRESTAGLTGTQYLERRRHDQAALAKHARALAAAAGPLVVDERTGPPSREAGPTRGAIFHLVRKRDVDAYRRAVASFARSLEPATVAITGPFAPFAFAPQL